MLKEICYLIIKMEYADSQPDISFHMGFPAIPHKLCIGHDTIDFPVEPNLVDQLSIEEKEKILQEEFAKYSLSKEDDLIKHDKKAIPVDWFPVRESVFTVLGKQGGRPVITEDQSIIDRADAREEKRVENERIHQERLAKDPVYAERCKIERQIMLALSQGNNDILPLTIF